MERLMVLIFNIFASKLSTTDYAIYGICNSVAIFVGYTSEAVSSYNQIELIKYNYTDRFKISCENCKKFMIICSLLAYITGIPMIIMLHGDTNLILCLLYAILFLTCIIGYTLNENFKTYLVVMKRTEYLKNGTFAGTVIRLIIIMICYKIHFSLLPFFIALCADHIIRGVVYAACGKKINLKKTKKDTENLK